MPPIVAAAAITAGATAGGQIYGAHKQASAQNKAAQLQAQAAAQALQFQREQAYRDQQNFNATQKANYDQWAAREGRLGTLGEMFGRGPRYIPPYVATAGSTMQPPAPIDPNRPQQFRRGNAGELIQY